MGIADRAIKRNIQKGLQKAGYDLNQPKQTTFRVMDNLIETSVGNYIDKKEMIKFLENHLNKLKDK